MFVETLKPSITDICTVISYDFSEKVNGDHRVFFIFVFQFYGSGVRIWVEKDYTESLCADVRFSPFWPGGSVENFLDYSLLNWTPGFKLGSVLKKLDFRVTNMPSKYYAVVDVFHYFLKLNSASFSLTLGWLVWAPMKDSRSTKGRALLLQIKLNILYLLFLNP